MSAAAPSVACTAERPVLPLAGGLSRPCAPQRRWHRAPQSRCRARRAVLRPPVAAAAGGGGAPPPDEAETPEAAFAAAQACMDLFSRPREDSSELDSVVEFLPEQVIDRLLERKKAKREEQQAGKQGQAAGPGSSGAAAGSASAQPAAGSSAASSSAAGGPAAPSSGLAEDDSNDLSFEELVALAQPSDLALDAYAARGLLTAAPRSAAVLSSLKLAPDRFLQRYEVVAQSGEEMVLILDMQLEESLQPKYRGLQVVKRWFLRGITGEPAYPGDVPTKPAPCWGPEAVVQAQLQALQIGDIAGVFLFASPENKEATGPVERFGSMLQSGVYRPLLNHEAADLLRTVSMAPGRTLVIVGIRSNIPTSEPGVTQRVVYSWALRLQPPDAPPDVANCWMTDGVQPISQSGLFTL